MKRWMLSIMVCGLLLAGCGGGEAVGPSEAAGGTPTATLTPTGAADFISHTVAAGDSCAFVASLYGAPVDALQDANGLPPDCSRLSAGQVLRIPRAALTPAPGASLERIDLIEAQERVRAHIFATIPDMNPSAVFPLVEVTTDAVWDGLGAQVYKVAGDVQANQTYVIRGGQVTPIGESFGGSGVHSLLPVELDGAPPMELLYAYEFGSGRRISSVGVYQASAGGVRAFGIDDFLYPGTLAIDLRGGAVVVSGRPDATGPGVPAGTWRDLGTVQWVDGRPIIR